ncbi:hypothetical protein ACLB2K_033529 [Fragaria x ananassa]
MADDDDDVSSTLPHVGGFRLRWDVFLSFRGEDTRETITKNLYEALQRDGVRVFLDNDGLDRGDYIGPTLLEAIEDSTAAIIVLSPRYADSRWCLKELAKICEGRRRLILPLFYQVDPSHVRRQTGPFEEHFRLHEQVFDSATVSGWRTAMTRVGEKAGFVFNSSRNKKNSYGSHTVPSGTSFPSRRGDEAVRYRIQNRSVIGVHGMGGIGKTTLAKALFNRLVGYFERHSFISNVRESSAKGLITLQTTLISDLSKGKMRAEINQTSDGIAAIKVAVNEKRVLVVLDDVDNIDQLSALVGNGRWFYKGSRIIVTTRDRELLPNHGVVNLKLYEVRELDASHALQLFSHHALGVRENPASTFLKLSKQIVALTGGLPLAIEVFGCSLYDKRRVEVWTDALEKLKRIRPGNLQDVLMISYNGLDDQEKCIFLDIACLFVKMKTKREDAVVIFKGCGFNGEIGLTVLTARSLIKIAEDTTLWMHNQLRDMGREIVTKENDSHPGMRSRLWDRDEIMNVFEHDKVLDHFIPAA